ncbi:tripartite tricarboxylate transporter substrate binding protein [Caldovatus sp. SYSU G05006]|uniref:Tripartite tricarboxylate transporter substrate binding protein n=1 Tax=Caldovatus aquaticus TaxID=2865671 RepID=A0ABS7EZS8_9PROT|nr:tripartite tricarboxylate transporter substrate binding protein [Caldovatus aquaticus]
MCRKDLPAGDLAGFAALAKARSGQIRFASGGVGTGQHLAGELLSLRLGARMVHIPYRGTGPAMTDLIAGNVDVYFGDTSVWQATQQGQARLLAVSTASRWRQSPDIPAIREAVPGFDIANWYGVAAPPGTPNAIRGRLRDEIAAALAQEEVAETLRRIGFEPAPLPPAEFAAFVRAELTTWAAVVQAAGIRAD